MTEEGAREWVKARFGVPRGTSLARFCDLLRDEAGNQNLISASSLDHIWERHIVDSAQLVPLAEGAGEGPWVDIGSGAGLPGIVVAIVTDRPVLLVEPRARRVAFLRDCIAALDLRHATVLQQKVETAKLDKAAAVISARAVAELSTLLSAARSCADSSTIWVLPKGQSAQLEVDAARRNWHGVFHVEPSVTQQGSGIVVAKGVRPR